MSPPPGRSWSDACASFIEGNRIETSRRPWHPSVRPRVLVGVLAGALASLFTEQLGAWEIARLDPQFALLGCAALGGAVGYLGRNVILHGVNGVLFLCFAVIAYTPLMSHWAGTWVRRDSTPRDPIAAIIVLSSGVLPDTGLDTFGTERLLSGLELWRQQVAPRIVTSRVTSVYDGHRVTSDADQQRLVDLAGAGSAWTTLDNVASTHDEAVAAVGVLGRGSRIAVVTSPLHTRRACRTFEVTGFIVYCVPARVRSHATTGKLSPRGRLTAFRAYLYERAAMLQYRSRGWV